MATTVATVPYKLQCIVQYCSVDCCAVVATVRIPVQYSYCVQKLYSNFVYRSDITEEGGGITIHQVYGIVEGTTRYRGAPGRILYNGSVAQKAGFMEIK